MHIYYEGFSYTIKFLSHQAVIKNVEYKILLCICKDFYSCFSIAAIIDSNLTFLLQLVLLLRIVNQFLEKLQYTLYGTILLRKKGYDYFFYQSRQTLYKLPILKKAGWPQSWQWSWQENCPQKKCPTRYTS